MLLQLSLAVYHFFIPYPFNYEQASVTDMWTAVEQLLPRAKQLAECRQQQLLIYFATDDAHNLQAEAQRKFGRYGRVVVGLLEHEVGHTSPQWTGRDKSVEELTVEYDSVSAASASSSMGTGTSSSNSKATGLVTNNEGVPLTLPKQRDADSLQKHADFALVEW